MGLTLAQLTNPGSPQQLQGQVLANMGGLGLPVLTGSGTGNLTLSGAPTGSYSAVVQIIATGEPGTATFQYSLDGGVTWSATLTAPSVGSMSLGLSGASVSFAAGPAGSGSSFVAGDEWTFSLFASTLPVLAWQDGSVPKTLALSTGTALSDLEGLIAQIARGGFVTPQPGVTGAAGSWLALAGQARYGLTPNPASAAQLQVLLTDTAGAGPFPISAGQLWVANTVSLGAATPLRYSNLGGGTLPKSGTLALTFQAEQPGAQYNVGDNTITTLLTSLPGVTVNNPTPSGMTSSIVAQGVSAESDLAYALRCLGRWAQLGSGSPAAAYQAWAATASAEVTRTNVAPVASSTAISGSNASTSNILVTSSAGFPVGAIVRASADGSYRLVTAVPDGTHITVAPAFGAAPTTGTLSVVSGGQISLYVAGPSGPVSSAALAAIAALITPKVAMPASIVIANAATTTVTITATVNILAAQLTATQAACEAALLALMQSIPIGGTVYTSQIIDALQKQPGVRNVALSAPSSDTVISTGVVPLLAGTRTYTGV